MLSTSISVLESSFAFQNTSIPKTSTIITNPKAGMSDTT